MDLQRSPTPFAAAPTCARAHVSSSTRSRLPTVVQRPKGLRVKTLVNIVLSFTVLVVLFGLDVRDIWYKTQFIGPYDSFAVAMISIDPFQKLPMVLAASRNTTKPGTMTPMGYSSGWGSLLESCDGLHAISSSNFFLQAMGTNCTFGDKYALNAATYRAKYVFLASSARVDAVAWASCQLLLVKRRPSVCQTTLVTRFLIRYNIAPPLVLEEWTVQPDSPGEQELLSLLDVIALSSSLHKMTCFGGFELDYEGSPVGEYNFTIFGCGSADHHMSALAGHFAPSLVELLHDKFWLTVDVLNILGFHFSIRQNDKALGIITQSDPNDRDSLRLTHRTYCNFSSFGPLYVFVITIDMILMLLHLATAIEMALCRLLPMGRCTASDDEMRVFECEDYCNFFSRSLDRSKPVILLTIFTELLSWMIILPNSVIWTWGLDNNTKFQALLSTIRLWILLLLAINLMWDLVVVISETHAYQIAKRTYLTPMELIGVGLCLCYHRRTVLFNIGGTKYNMEHQRLLEIDTFRNPMDGSPMVAYGNAVNEQLDFLVSTSTPVLCVLYKPLFHVLSACLLVIFAFAALKMVFFHFYHFRLKARQLTQVSASSASSGLSKRTLSAGGPHNLMLRKRSTLRNVLETVPGLRVNADERTLSRLNAQYKRLPLEQLLDTPIRARSLVRDSLEMEVVLDGKLSVRPSLYFDFGVLVTNAMVRSRVGFFGAVGTPVRLDQPRRTHRNSSSAYHSNTKQGGDSGLLSDFFTGSATKKR